MLDEACWQGPPTLTQFRLVDQPDTPHPQQTRLWIRYDEEYLYVAAACEVADMQALRARLAASPEQVQSGIRLYLDWRNARRPVFYEEYHLDANGSAGYVFSPGNPRLPVRPIDELKIDTLMPRYYRLNLPTDYLRSAVRLTEVSYAIEAAIPFAMMHLDPEAAQTWALKALRLHDPEAEGSAAGTVELRVQDEATQVSATASFWGTETGDVKLYGDLALHADLSRYYWGLRLDPPRPGDRGVRVQLDNQTGQAFTGALALTITRRGPDSPRHRPDGEAFDYRRRVRMQAGQQTEVRFAHAISAPDLEARYQLTLMDATGRRVLVGSTSRKDDTPGDEWAAPEPMGAEAELGYLVYSRPYTVPMTHRSVPRREEVITELCAFGTPGEYVPLVFSLYAWQDVNDLRATVSDLSGPDEAVLPAEAVEVRYVQPHTFWQERWIAYGFKSLENLLRRFGRMNLVAGRSQRFWLTAKLGDEQPPGMYTGTVTLASEAGQTVLDLELEVLPFKLADVEDIGYFIYANGAMTVRGAEFARKVAKDMRAHGMTTATNYIYSQVGERQNQHRLVVDEPVGYTPETGYAVDPKANNGLTYAQLTDILVEEGFARKVPLIDMYAAGMSPGNWYKASVVADLDKAYKERGWPEVLYYLVDEPENSAKLVRQTQRRQAELKTHGLDLKYTTALVGRNNHRDLTDAVAPIYDVWILNELSPAVMVKGLAMGKELWSYGCSYSWTYGTADLQHYFGRYLWASRLRGASLWAYNAGRGPRNRFFSHVAWNAFDPLLHHLDFTYAWNLEDEIIPTAKWEAIREGIDDHRYLRTLERMAQAAATAPQDDLRAAGQAGSDLLAEIRGAVPPVVGGGFVADSATASAGKSAFSPQVTPSLAEIHTERGRVVEAIMAILEAGGVVPAAAARKVRRR